MAIEQVGRIEQLTETGSLASKHIFFQDVDSYLDDVFELEFYEDFLGVAHQVIAMELGLV